MSIFKHSSLSVLFLLASGWVSSPSAQTASKAYKRVVTINGESKTLTSRLKAVLVTEFFYNYNHNVGIPNLVETMKRIGGVEGWKVDVASDGNQITTTKLKGYQVLFGNYISSWASKADFGAVGRAAVQSFVEQDAGGVVIMHASGDSRLSGSVETSIWPWFYDVAHPTIYVGEGTKSGQAPVFIPPTAKTHPIMDGVNFSGKDTVIFTKGEWHQFSKNISTEEPKVEILLKMDYTQNTDAEKDFAGYKIPGGYPCAWTFPDKLGHIGYFMEGHDLNTMQNMKTPMWDKFWTQFMYYMAGYDTTGGVSVQGPRTNLDFALENDGITFHPNREPGVLVTRSGNHQVTLLDMSGRTLQEFRGRTPTDYNFAETLQGARTGVYVMRVAISGRVKSKRFFRN